MKTKPFDCVEMKRQAQEKIYAEIAAMSDEEKIAYYRHTFQQIKAKQEKLRVQALTVSH
jgi:DNA/RNA-binding domain of Phe-tRNA-synthetase-like protein